jgi:hypothetical protein
LRIGDILCYFDSIHSSLVSGVPQGHTVLRHFFDVTEVFKSILKDIPALKTISGSGDADPLQNYSNFTK